MTEKGENMVQTEQEKADMLKALIEILRESLDLVIERRRRGLPLVNSTTPTPLKSKGK